MPKTAPPPPLKTKAAAKPVKVLTMAAFARRHQKQQSHVTLWIKEGLPVINDNGRKRVDVKKGDAWVARRLATRGTPAPVQKDPLAIRQLEANLVLREAQGRRELIRVKVEEGALVERAPLMEALSAAVLQLRSALMELPLQVASDVAPELGVDVAPLRAALDRAIRQALERSAGAFTRI